MNYLSFYQAVSVILAMEIAFANSKRFLKPDVEVPQWTKLEQSIWDPHPNITAPFNPDAQEILISGGPSAPFQRAKAAFQLAQIGMFGQSLVKLQEEVKHGIQYLFQTRNNVTLAIAGTGTMGMEVIFDNLVEPGDKVLLPGSGLWSPKVSGIVKRKGGVPILIEKPFGKAFSIDEIKALVEEHRPQILHIVMGESSVGMLQRVEGLGEVCKMHNCILTVDVCHVVAIQPFFMDKWGVDAVFTNVQKGIGAPVGLSPISFSEKAIAKILARNTSSALQVYDVKIWMQKNFWKINGPHIRQVPIHSIPVLLLYTLREALSILADEGLVNSWRKHYVVNKHFEKMLMERFPELEYFIDEPENRLLGALMLKFREGRDTVRMGQYFLNKHKVEIGTGFGPMEGKLLRFAFIGSGANMAVTNRAFAVITEGFRKFNVTESH